MNLGFWDIDDTLTFPCNTHTASTGAATDADSVPTYRVYEDETGTAILTGSMAKLDDANTTGFYTEQITLSAANGFELGKCYTIYISATVGGVTGTMSHNFQMSEVEDKIDTVDGIVDDILVDTGTTLDGKLDTIDGNVDSILTDTGTTLPGTLTTIEGKIDTVDGIVDNILIDTGTTLDGKLDTIDGIVDDILVDTGTTIPGTITTIDGKIDTIDGIVDSIVADTNELQTDWADGGRLDLLLDAASTHDAAAVVTALKASTGYTAGGTSSFATVMKVIAAAVAGDVSDGDTSDYNYGDIDDNSEVFAITVSETTPYKNVTIA